MKTVQTITLLLCLSAFAMAVNFPPRPAASSMTVEYHVHLQANYFHKGAFMNNNTMNGKEIVSQAINHGCVHAGAHMNLFECEEKNGSPVCAHAVDLALMNLNAGSDGCEVNTTNTVDNEKYCSRMEIPQAACTIVRQVVKHGYIEDGWAVMWDQMKLADKSSNCQVTQTAGPIVMGGHHTVKYQYKCKADHLTSSGSLLALDGGFQIYHFDMGWDTTNPAVELEAIGTMNMTLGNIENHPVEHICEMPIPDDCKSNNNENEVVDTLMRHEQPMITKKRALQSVKELPFTNLIQQYFNSEKPTFFSKAH